MAMSTIDPKTAAALKKAFAEFMNEPLFQLQVKFRRYRSAELRQMLAEPEVIDLKEFNREVWRLETYTTRRGEDITGKIYEASLTGRQTVNSNEVAEIDASLEAGEISFHGNSIWGTASQIFGTALNLSEEEKLASVRQALHILNETDITPFEKAERIDAIPGFGYNSATGLVMVYHPEEFAIYNTPPRTVFKELGLAENSLQSFQDCATALREVIGAEDFLELDWFLYLIHEGVLEIESQPRYWWVNQGVNFDHEFQHQYIFAGVTTQAGRTLQHHKNVSRVKPGDIIFHNARGALQAVSRAFEKAHTSRRPGADEGDADQPEGFLVKTSYSKLGQSVPLPDIPLEWRRISGGPFDTKGNPKQGYLYPVTYQFAERMGAKFSDLMPDYVPRGTLEQRVWIFQANPRIFDLEARLEEVEKAGPEADSIEEWTVSRYESRMQPGDIALIWKAGQNAGIYATAEFTGTFFDRPPELSSTKESERATELRYTGVLSQPIFKEELLKHPVLRHMQIIRIPQGTNFPVTEDEWTALQPMLSQSPLVLDDYQPPTFERIQRRIADEGLRITEYRLRQYHLALISSRFVILAGNSGTGKTWLALSYAKAVGAEACIVPVAPNWNTNEDLLGYYNPFEKAYNDTQFSRFLRAASQEYERHARVGVQGKPYHLILDEMNLARVEYYFARFLSAMELTTRGDQGKIELSPGEEIILPPTLHFVGTVNVDETTHSFADKIYDRAQLIQLDAPRDLIEMHLEDAEYASAVLEIWDAVRETAPFGYRVIDQLESYIEAARLHGVDWQAALDEQVLHKVLPKIKGAEPHVGDALAQLQEITHERLPLSHQKAIEMQNRFRNHGFTSYF
jgi:MoxR-like ATPase